MAFALGFDKLKPEDQRFEIQSIPVLIEKKHLMFLMGMQLDFLRAMKREDSRLPTQVFLSDTTFNLLF